MENDGGSAYARGARMESRAISNRVHQHRYKGMARAETRPQ